MNKAHNLNFPWILSTLGRLFHITKSTSMSRIPLFFCIANYAGSNTEHSSVGYSPIPKLGI